MTDDKNAFDPDQAPGIQLIVQMRLYDALMALLTEISPEKARTLIELHAQGTMVGSSPTNFSGIFLADEQSLQE